MTALNLFDLGKVAAEPPVRLQPPKDHSRPVSRGQLIGPVAGPDSAPRPITGRARVVSDDRALELGAFTLWARGSDLGIAGIVLRTADGALEVRTRGQTANFSTRAEGIPLLAVRRGFEALRLLRAGGRLELLDERGGELGRLAAALPQDAFPELDREIELLDRLIVIEKHFSVALAVPSTPEQLVDIDCAYEAARTGRWHARRASFTMPCAAELLRRLAKACAESPGGTLMLKFTLPRELDLPGARVVLGPVKAIVEQPVFDRSPEEMLRIADQLEPGKPFELGVRSGSDEGVVTFEYVDHLPIEELQDRHAKLSDKEIARSLSPDDAGELEKVRHALEHRLATPPVVSRRAEGSQGNPRTSAYGLWRDLGVEITEADIAEARREMWGDFPRDGI